MKSYTLRPGTHLTQIYVYRDPVDFRKGHRGLSKLIERELGHDVQWHALRVRQSAALQNQMFFLYYKARAEEKFHGPQADEDLITLTGEQLNWLLGGYNLGLMRSHRSLHYESVA